VPIFRWLACTQAKQCLEEHRKELSPDCKQEVEGMIARRVADFRLDSRLRKACENSIFSMCAFLGDLDSMDTHEGEVIKCLQVGCCGVALAAALFITNSVSRCIAGLLQSARPIHARLLWLRCGKRVLRGW